MKKTISYAFLVLLAFSVIPLTAASGDTLSTSDNTIAVQLESSALIESDKGNTGDTIDRFARIIENAESIKNNLEPPQAKAVSASILGNIIQEMTEIKNEMDPKISREDNAMYIEAFKAKMQEFKDEVHKFADVRVKLRTRY